MAEVEIISMLIPASASTSNVRAATPGLDFIPAPTRLTRAIPASVVTRGRADLAGQGAGDLLDR